MNSIECLMLIDLPSPSLLPCVTLVNLLFCESCNSIVIDITSLLWIEIMKRLENHLSRMQWSRTQSSPQEYLNFPAKTCSHTPLNMVGFSRGHYTPTNPLARPPPIGKHLTMPLKKIAEAYIVKENENILAPNYKHCRGVGTGREGVGCWYTPVCQLAGARQCVFKITCTYTSMVPPMKKTTSYATELFQTLCCPKLSYL